MAPGFSAVTEHVSSFKPPCTACAVYSLSLKEGLSPPMIPRPLELVRRWIRSNVSARFPHGKSLLIKYSSNSTLDWQLLSCDWQLLSCAAT